MNYLQQDAQASEELAALLSRNLTFQPQSQVTQQQLSEQAQPEPITYSISQHYHHSAHVIHHEPVAEVPRPSSEPPQTQYPSNEQVRQVLAQYGVAYTGLTTNQLDLFKTADTPQQLRLIELWRICPPTNPQSHVTVDSINTSVEQEERLAQLRYEQQVAAEEAKRNSIISLDGTPLTPVQTTEGHWVHTSDPEPYMASGYEMMARREYEESARRQLAEDWPQSKSLNDLMSDYRPATDPVYQNSRPGVIVSFGANNYARQQQAMEDQYGAYQQMEY
ncbi:hypothetical protein F5Y18DRAFT_312595 [Xylariaceae sp. FL1019]|nr:hypothetical protein F5Y18DRAFT_312595 [Xylariaceae sp. FL1019]